MHNSLQQGGKVIANVFYPAESGLKLRSFNAIYSIDGKPVELGYRPKDGDIIEVHFLKRAGDQSPEPEVFASTKIVYYSTEFIKKSAQEAGFSQIVLFENWQDNLQWKAMFDKNNSGLETKAKPFLLLAK